MKKTFVASLEFIDFVLTLVGIIGLLTTIFEVQNRHRPDLTVLIATNDFAEMAQDPTIKPIIEQVTAVEIDYIYHKDFEAVNDLSKIIIDHSDYIPAYYFRGLIYLYQGYIDQGLSDLRKVKQYSLNADIRQNATKEIFLAQLAQILTPLGLISTLCLAIIFILAKKYSKKGSPWARPLLRAFIVVGILFSASFIFLLSH